MPCKSRLGDADLRSAGGAGVFEENSPGGCGSTTLSVDKHKVCVEVDAAPQQDLNKVLDDIRWHYETIIDCREQEC
ncbi:hypothetical protein cypCar_00050032 [Cyprinus carpio]|nr:hypothetical protein cypCar_00050032 [Cyprinus carpio]